MLVSRAMRPSPRLCVRANSSAMTSFLDLGAIEMQQRNAFAFGLSVGLFAQAARQFLAVLRKVTAQDAALVQVAVDAADMVEQTRFAPEPQPIKAGENETNQSVKTG